MSNLSFEKSTEAAKPVKEINELALELDTEYLWTAYEEMQDKHLRSESAAVLDPHPFTHNERQEVNAAKLHQLKLIIQLGENAKVILEKTIALQKAEKQTGELEKIFGI
jgi:hypothetical protein